MIGIKNEYATKSKLELIVTFAEDKNLENEFFKFLDLIKSPSLETSCQIRTKVNSTPSLKRFGANNKVAQNAHFFIELQINI